MGARYSCWYLPLNKECYILLRKQLSPAIEFDTSQLRSYLLKRKRVDETKIPGEEPLVVRANQPVAPIESLGLPEPSVPFRKVFSKCL